MLLEDVFRQPRSLLPVRGGEQDTMPTELQLGSFGFLTDVLYKNSQPQGGNSGASYERTAAVYRHLPGTRRK
jgi:hypothetical protein